MPLNFLNQDTLLRVHKLYKSAFIAPIRINTKDAIKPGDDFNDPAVIRRAVQSYLPEPTTSIVSKLYDRVFKRKLKRLGTSITAADIAKYKAKRK